jgi:hypothetical protein
LTGTNASHYRCNVSILTCVDLSCVQTLRHSEYDVMTLMRTLCDDQMLVHDGLDLVSVWTIDEVLVSSWVVTLMGLGLPAADEGSDPD